MSVKTKPITVRVSPEVFEYLGERAEKEHRTLSNTVNTILIEAKEAGTGADITKQHQQKSSQVIKAEWNTVGHRGDIYFSCSNCTFEQNYPSKFCPNCGAAMSSPSKFFPLWDKLNAP